MTTTTLLSEVKAVVQAVEPTADVILFGSRARDQACADSDWDFLILVSGEADDARIDKIRHQLYEIEWTSGEVLSSIVWSREEWDSDPYRLMPLHQEVERDGVRL